MDLISYIPIIGITTGLYYFKNLIENIDPKNIINLNNNNNDNDNNLDIYMFYLPGCSVCKAIYDLLKNTYICNITLINFDDSLKEQFISRNIMNVRAPIVCIYNKNIDKFYYIDNTKLLKVLTQ